MKFVSSDDGVKISYRSFGDGSRAVFLIHGWMVSGAVYDAMLEYLDFSGLRVIVPDLRGAGQSDKPETGYSIKRYAEDVLAIADAEGIKSFVAFGHSMGGQIAQWLAAHHPDRISAAALACSVPASGIAMPEDTLELFANAGGNREAQNTILVSACKELTDAAREKLLDDSVNTSPAAVRLSFDVWRKGGFSEALCKIVAPVIYITTDDPYLPPAFVRSEVISKIKGARLAVLPGPGHYLQVEKPRETAALLEAFLAALPR